MNQILDYNPNKSSGSGKNSSGSDTVVRVFAIILVVFALCLLGSGIYGMYKNRSKEKVSPTDSQSKAVITVERDENDDTKAIIRVKHDKAIEKVIYTWDNDKDMINKGNGKPTMDIEISLPAGTHTLTVKVTDIDGVDTTYDEEIYSENGEDKVSPEIKTTVDQATKEIVITATDDTELDYVTYRWNDEDEMRENANEDNPKEIKFNIEIPKGTNDLTIIAVDKNNNSTTKTDKYTGVTKPEITITVSEDKKRIDVYCYHENGILEVTVSINGDVKKVDLGGQILQEVPFGFDLEEGHNTILITAKSVDGTETEAGDEIDSTSTPDPVEEGNIEITFERYEDIADKVLLKIVTSSPIAEGTVDINDGHYGLDQAVGLKEAPLDIPLPEEVNKVKVWVKTEDGTEKTVEEELRQG